jgi:hypothetical protein
MVMLDQKPANGKYENSYSSIKRSMFIVFTWIQRKWKISKLFIHSTISKLNSLYDFLAKHLTQYFSVRAVKLDHKWLEGEINLFPI